jgi:FixJ family two-component response regulator
MSITATVFLVDDDDSVRKGLANLLRSAGYTTRTFASGCIILDMRMPETDGLEVQATLAEQGYHPPVIFLTGHGDVPNTVTALKKGAVDFLEKPVDETVLLAAVADALEKDRQNREQLNQTTDAKARLAGLTPREFEVLRYVIGGNLNKQIAYTLAISEKTVKAHRARVMEKMAVSSVAELVRLTENAEVQPAAINTPKVQ